MRGKIISCIVLEVFGFLATTPLIVGYLSGHHDYYENVALGSGVLLGLLSWIPLFIIGIVILCTINPQTPEREMVIATGILAILGGVFIVGIIVAILALRNSKSLPQPNQLSEPNSVNTIPPTPE